MAQKHWSIRGSKKGHTQINGSNEQTREENGRDEEGAKWGTNLKSWSGKDAFIVEMRSMRRRLVADSLRGPSGLDPMGAIVDGLDANSSTYYRVKDEK